MEAGPVVVNGRSAWASLVANRQETGDAGGTGRGEAAGVHLDDEPRRYAGAPVRSRVRCDRGGTLAT